MHVNAGVAISQAGFTSHSEGVSDTNMGRHMHPSSPCRRGERDRTGLCWGDLGQDSAAILSSSAFALPLSTQPCS